MPAPAPPPTVPVFGDRGAAYDWVGGWRDTPVDFAVRDEPRGFAGEPAFCVAIERFPEEWPASRVRALLAAFPLAAWVVAAGPWAAGGGRTGSPWPPAVRCSPAESRRRVAAVLRGERVPAATDSPEGVYLQPQPRSRSHGSGLGAEAWDPAAVQSVAPRA